jgi:hypothetical protein
LQYCPTSSIDENNRKILAIKLQRIRSLAEEFGMPIPEVPSDAELTAVSNRAKNRSLSKPRGLRPTDEKPYEIAKDLVQAINDYLRPLSRMQR